MHDICTNFYEYTQRMEQTAQSTQEKYRRNNEELWKKTQTLKDTQLSLNLSTGQGSSQGYNLNKTQFDSVGPPPRGQMAGEASQHKNKGMYKGVQLTVEYDFFGLNKSTGNESTMVNQSYPNCSSFEINFGEQMANEANYLCDQSYGFIGLNKSTGNESTMVNQSYPNCSSFEINFGEQMANEANYLCDQSYGFIGMNTSTGNESTMANQSYNSSFRPRENPQSGNLKSTKKSKGKKTLFFWT